jgi:hypothetical protein
MTEAGRFIESGSPAHDRNLVGNCPVFLPHVNNE